MPRILIVEDEAAIADTLIFALQAEGFETRWVQLAGVALDSIRDNTPDLVILDVGLSDINGFEACKRLRQFSDVPVLFLTARNSEIDRVVGLEIGADDYVVKPFSPREVAARVKVILKRISKKESRQNEGTAFNVDAEKLQISYRGKALQLTRHEFKLLQALLSQPEKVLTREQLLQSLGVAMDVGYERNIDTHIKSVRAKLREIAPEREPIQTHRGFGYSYNPERS